MHVLWSMKFQIGYLIGRNFVGRNYSSGEILSPNEKFVTFARRIICPIKVKVCLVELQVNLRGVQVIQTIVIISLGETLPGEIFVAFKNSSLQPDKVSPYFNHTVAATILRKKVLCCHPLLKKNRHWSGLWLHLLESLHPSPILDGCMHSYQQRDLTYLCD